MTPATAGLTYEDVAFSAEDGTALHGWFIPGQADRPVLLFFHGNAGNISDRVDNLARLNRLGLSVFIFDYRGYGRSAGKTTETGIYSDSLGASAWLKQRGYPPEKTIYFGRSLGAAAALQLALKEPPAALILESGFTSVAEMGRKHYPVFYRLFGWLLAAEFDNAARITRLKAPLLVIHGTADTIVPVAMGKELYRLAPDPKRLYLIRNADHNDGFYLEAGEYWSVWRQFLQSIETTPEERDL